MGNTKIEMNFLPTFERMLKKHKLDAGGIKEKLHTELQHYVDEHPESFYFPNSGAGMGNTWKIRVDGRGGFRVVYYAVPKTRHFDFIMIYPKNVQDNITAKQKKIIQTIIKQLED